MRFLTMALAFLLCICSACFDPDSGNGNPSSGSVAVSEPTYLVTVTPLALLLRELCDQRARVGVLLPPGANSHTYDPAPADVQAITQATAFFWVGPDYDGWAADFETKNSISVLGLLPPEKLLPLGEHAEWSDPAAAPAEDYRRETDHPHAGEHAEHSPTHDHDHHHDERPHWDPHFLVDPLTVQSMLPAIVQELTRLDPGGAKQYQENAGRIRAKLSALHQELTDMLLPAKGEPVIMFHPSFRYFLRSYGMRDAGLIEPSPGKEPTPKYLQGIVKAVREQQVKALFSETLLPAAPVTVIAEAAGVPVVELDPACGNSGETYSDYCAWVRHNARLMREALQ